MKVLILEDSESRLVQVIQDGVLTQVKVSSRSLTFNKSLATSFADTFAIYARGPILDWAIADRGSDEEKEAESFIIASYRYFLGLLGSMSLSQIKKEAWNAIGVKV